MPKTQTPQTLMGLAKMLSRQTRRVLVVPDRDAARPVTNRDVLDVGRIPGFSAVTARGRKVTIASGATLGQVQDGVRGENGLMKQAISMMVNPLVRNRVTVLESLEPDSPYFDLATVLLALNANVRIQSISGVRTVPITEYLLAVAGDLKPGEFPAMVDFARLGEEWRVGCFRVNPGSSKNTVSAAIVTRIRKNVAIEPKVYVSSSSVIPVFAPLTSNALSRKLLSDNNVKMVAEQAGQEMLELEGIEDDDPYESSLIEVAVSRAIRRLNAIPPTV